jgi:hypothetical protein
LPKYHHTNKSWLLLTCVSPQTCFPCQNRNWIAERLLFPRLLPTSLKVLTFSSFQIFKCKLSSHTLFVSGDLLSYSIPLDLKVWIISHVVFPAMLTCVPSCTWNYPHFPLIYCLLLPVLYCFFNWDLPQYILNILPLYFILLHLSSLFKRIFYSPESEGMDYFSCSFSCYAHLCSILHLKLFPLPLYLLFTSPSLILLL